MNKDIPINDIKPNPKNPRNINEIEYKNLVQSLKEFPVMTSLREVILDENNMIIGGNMRYKAAQEAGWPNIKAKIFTREMAELNNKLTNQNKSYEEYCDEFVIKDNISSGDWDWDILANEWGKENLLKWGLEIRDYHSLNDLETDFEDLDVDANGDFGPRLILSFKTETELLKFLNELNVELNNNYKKVGNSISMNWPPEVRKDIKNVRFE